MAHEVILAPVPLVHLESAERIAAGRLVVFSTDLPPFAPAWEGREIYFFASGAGYRGASVALSKVPYRANFVRYVASVAGRYEGPGLRPASALETDGKSGAFYEVADFERLPRPLLIGLFRKLGGGAFAKVERPFDARLPE